MNADEIEGRLLALECFAWSVLNGLLAVWHTGDTEGDQRAIAWLDTIKRQAEIATQMAQLSPEASHAMAEMTDKMISSLSENMVHLRRDRGDPS